MNRTKASFPSLEGSLIPSDFSDVGQAKLFSGIFGDRLRYNPATDWLVFDGSCWRENKLDAQAMAQALTEKQVKQAQSMKRCALDAAMTAQERNDDVSMKSAKTDEAKADAFYRYALGRRKSGAISATLTEARPNLQIQLDELDRDPFLLNTPAGTVDLRTGALKAHDPSDFCTKITGVSPSSEGADIFASFLDTVTVGDRELEAYLQAVAGMFALGAVFNECLTIAYGSGRNGKSTFFNLLGRVLGDYSGALSAETLTVNCRQNKSPEFAELRGKRFVIAAELEEGLRLDTAVAKKLCSTDKIYATKKYRDPMQFTPSHSILLFTNHLPKVGTSDAGTWRRLVVIPFRASITDAGDRKDFGSYLFHQAGGAVLSWVIEGAQHFIAAGYKLEQPKCVRDAIAEYRSDNDWLSTFVSDCCIETHTTEQTANGLYMRYQGFCASNKEFCRSAADFRRAIENAGYSYKRKKSGMFVCGLQVKPWSFSQTSETTPWDESPAPFA